MLRDIYTRRQTGHIYLWGYNQNILKWHATPGHAKSRHDSITADGKIRYSRVRHKEAVKALTTMAKIRAQLIPAMSYIRKQSTLGITLSILLNMSYCGCNLSMGLRLRIII